MWALKITLVPALIAGITLIGRRWGARVAGIFAGLPVVAGPIVLVIAIEQGRAFGARSATSALSAVAGLLAYGVVYSWACLRASWPSALVVSLGAWSLVAIALARLPALLGVALAVAALSVWLAPALLPRRVAVPAGRLPALQELPLRMLAGAALTLAVTAAAAEVGEAWSGILAVFPVMGVVLAVFTQRNEGAAHVAQLFLGVVRGLYSFVAFFLVLALALPRMAVSGACAAAVLASLLVQIAAQVWSGSKRADAQIATARSDESSAA